MNIEVTNSTFYKIFKGNEEEYLSTENLESAKKHHYYNDENEQGGIILYNFTSSKTIIQYYLTDINA
tara:strand:+ start:302 stop:502 length:201 start_codon:yes stop_codon:yes gene_type:complete